jgi:hypothetical protein
MTIHEICEEARHTLCVCGAGPDQPCIGEPGGTCLARIARACRCGWITEPDFASVIHDAGVFTGTTRVLDPAAVAA